MENKIFTSRYAIPLGILLTGLCYFFGNGLSGDYWYLVWIAPVPILYLSFIHNRKVVLIIAFIAYLIGKLSWFGYLATVVGIVPTIIIILAISLVFAGIVILTRATVLRLNNWYAVFAFPLYFTAFEFLLIRLSADGTATSIAYSQMKCLPLIQVAAFGGILAITFIITLIPSLLVFAKNKSVLLLIPVILLSGYWRIKNGGEKIKVGLIAMEESRHNSTVLPSAEKDSLATSYYLQQIDTLNAQIVLLPERALSISTNAVKRQLQDAAKRNKLFIIAGYTNLTTDAPYNSAIVIDDNGNILTDYNKRHLVTGFERAFTPGKDIGIFRLHHLQAGIAICKDLDFHEYIRQYGKQEPAILFIPAWDFVVDDWLHASMAILRGVENGFCEVRAARTGLLTISDCYGRVIAASSTTKGQYASLVGEVQVKHVSTFYTKFGDWIGWLSLIGSIALQIFVFRRLKVSGDIPR